jgi:hypothetical protein
MSGKVRIVLLAAASFVACGVWSGAYASTPSNSSSVDHGVLQSQATSLLSQFLQDIAREEASGKQKNLSSADRQAAIETALQNSITQSGDDPRAVLATLRALRRCTPGSEVPENGVVFKCPAEGLPLSREALNAAAALERIVAATIDENQAPGAVGLTGNAPLGAPPAGGGAGGSSDYRI